MSRLPLTFALVLLAIEMIFLGAPAKPAHATHGSYVVQPVYFFASDMTNRFSTYQSKLNSYMAETNTWYGNAHLQSGDKFAMNGITWRQGSLTKASYCYPQPVSSCDLTLSLFGKVFDDLANPSSSAYLGYNPRTAKNVITFVFFDTIPASSVAAAWGAASAPSAAYNPEGYGGYALTGSYVMDSGAKGTPGHDSTIAHEIGHALRLNHNNVSGTCNIMYTGSGGAWCWDASSSLVNGQGSDGYWYLEKYAVHYSPFTRRDGATSPVSNLVASSPACGSIKLQWSALSGDSMTDRVVLLAPRGTKSGGDAGAAIYVDNIYLGISRTVASVGTGTSQYTASGLTPGWYHFTVATVNSVGQVHGWPNALGFYLSCGP